MQTFIEWNFIHNESNGRSPEVGIEHNTVIDENFIDQSFDHGLNNVKWTARFVLLNDNWVNLKVSYLFNDKTLIDHEKSNMKWQASFWSK